VNKPISRVAIAYECAAARIVYHMKIVRQLHMVILQQTVVQFGSSFDDFGQALVAVQAPYHGVVSFDLLQ
jgi:hypothetical protein